MFRDPGDRQRQVLNGLARKLGGILVAGNEGSVEVLGDIAGARPVHRIVRFQDHGWIRRLQQLWPRHGPVVGENQRLERPPPAAAWKARGRLADGFHRPTRTERVEEHRRVPGAFPSSTPHLRRLVTVRANKQVEIRKQGSEPACLRRRRDDPAAAFSQRKVSAAPARPRKRPHFVPSRPGSPSRPRDPRRRPRTALPRRRGGPPQVVGEKGQPIRSAPRADGFQPRSIPLAASSNSSSSSGCNARRDELPCNAGLSGSQDRLLRERGGHRSTR